MLYSHITQDERVALAQLIWAGKNQTEIAKRLGKEKGAISREI
jgi:IS30 family transposase